MVIEFAKRLRTLMIRERQAIKSSNTLSEWISTGLLALSHRMLFEPSTLALFGEVDPLSIEYDFDLFDSKIHYLTALLPLWVYSIFFRRVLQVRSRLNNSWLKKRHPPRESDFVRGRAIFILDHPESFSDVQYGGNQTAMLWGSLGNSIPAVFWCLLYILRDAKAVESIRQEINQYLPAFSLNDDDGSAVVEQWTLDRLASCVNLDSAVNETLRLVATPMVMRKCKEKTDLSLKDGRILHLEPNNAIALFPAVVHGDPDIFPNPDKFIFDRFVQKSADSVPSFLPFGNGKNICPGRFFIRNEIKICVAIILQHLELKFVDIKTVPKQKPHRVGVGVAPPSEDITIMYRYKL
ncbi:unnamed protein product [Rotaria sp. Silwood2]|nr:unnamed protein product [Rotaria sp. Silwood2]